MRRLKSIALAMAVLHLPLLLAEWVAPYPYEQQHREFSYTSPSLGVRGNCGVQWFHKGRLFSVAPPCGLFLFGTDAFGRDVFSRVLYGGRISILTGLAATLLALLIGCSAGILAGFRGGWTDSFLMRAGELFMALPWLYLLLGVRASLPLHISTLAAFLMIVSIVGTVGWVRPARLIRGVVLSARELGYVQAARSFGASGPYLVRRHILPLLWGVILTQATILLPQFILAEITLSFLGLGIAEPVPSWGNMLAEGRQYFELASHRWLLSPGVFLLPILLGYVVLSDRVGNSHRGGGSKAA
jgi:peptide/nickel transport system permease protein